MDNVPVYYCIGCGYVGSMPGNCPECGGEMIADFEELPNEKDEDQRYDDELLDEIEDTEEVEEDEDLG